MNEFEIIKKYFSILTGSKLPSLNLNDDVFFDRKKNLVISVDTYVDKIHFLNFKKPELVIKKILRSSISDLICKGVYPKYYFISGSGKKKNFSPKNLQKISSSLKKEQKKFNIILGGGDTVFSNKLSFTITSIGYSNKIVYRNKAQINDDIYVTGNLGDSYIGLKVLKNQIFLDKNFKKYFIKKYFCPILQMNLTKKLFNFANTSIDISDGLIADLEKLINKQKLSYKLNIEAIPISNRLKLLLKSNKNKIIKKSVISQGDDYQILFTAQPSKSGIIQKTAKKIGIKITRIGKIYSHSKKSSIIDENGNKIAFNLKGYAHRF